ncbi:hypothetical protein NYR30_08575 [Gallibacterium salpingitidis]|nr:hypothetical protein [Gallibacterium salpingitidis]WKT01092.1 hypothetical protein NYR30_08575 [Gallibacterium salpingitidis]
MKIIITGGQGFLGQRLARALLEHPSLNLKELLLLDINTPIVNLIFSKQVTWHCE